jgi:hypothetical protein
VQVNLSLDYSGEVSVKIVNVLGVCLLEKRFPASAKFSQNISLAGFPEGFYFVNFSSDNKTYIEKLIISER